jgi:hypothetical protein
MSSKIGVIGFYSTQASEQIAATCSKIASENPGLEIAHGDVVYGRAKLIRENVVTSSKRWVEEPSTPTEESMKASEAIRRM